jgi:flagellar motor switch protein FliG
MVFNVLFIKNLYRFDKNGHHLDHLYCRYIAMENHPKFSTGRRKLAILLQLIGPTAAEKILQELKKKESLKSLELIIMEMQQIHSLSHKDALFLLKELHAQLNEEQHLYLESEQILEELKKNHPQWQSSLFTSMHEAEKKIMDILSYLDEKQLLIFLQREHPQISTVMFLYLNQEKRASLFKKCSPSFQEQLILRISHMNTIDPQHIETLGQILEQVILPAQGHIQKGGLNEVVDFIKQISEKERKKLFDLMEKQNPNLVKQIEEKLFTFADLIHIPAHYWTILQKHIPYDWWKVALKNQQFDFTQTIIGFFPKRVREDIEQSLKESAPLKLSQVTAKQKDIIDVIEKLKSQGQLPQTLGAGEEEKFI